MKLLLTGGRAPVAVEMARALDRAGHQVVSAESVRFPLVRYSRACRAHYRVPPPRQQPEPFARKIREIVGEESIDLIVPTCEELFTVAQARPGCSVLAAPPEQLLRLHNKWTFHQTARDLGLPVPETLLLGTGAGAPGDLGRYVLKPVFSRSATRTLRPPHSRLPAMLPGAWMAQGYLEGPEVCSYSLAYRGRLVGHVAYTSEFQAFGAAVHFRSEAVAAVQDWARKFIEGTACCCSGPAPVWAWGEPC